jgi:transcriptional regulator with XRE-family HTH domain
MPISKKTIPGLGLRLRQLRAERALSQQVLATRAGISIPRLREAEQYNAATTSTLARLARALALDLDRLVGRTAEKFDPSEVT